MPASYAQGGVDADLGRVPAADPSTASWDRPIDRRLALQIQIAQKNGGPQQRTLGACDGWERYLSSHVESSLVLYSNGVVHDKAFAAGATMNARLDAEAGEGSDWAHLSDAGSLKARTPVCPAKPVCVLFSNTNNRIWTIESRLCTSVQSW